MTDVAAPATVINWAVSIVFGIVASGLLTMMLIFLQGLRRDIQDLSKKFDAQQAQLVEVRIQQGKMQEQVYTILRGLGESTHSSHGGDKGSVT